MLSSVLSELSYWILFELWMEITKMKKIFWKTDLFLNRINFFGKAFPSSISFPEFEYHLFRKIYE